MSLGRYVKFPCPVCRTSLETNQAMEYCPVCKAYIGDVFEMRDGNEQGINTANTFGKGLKNV